MTDRDSGPDESSLELLLDTICNTFGVVLFISMLVVVMVNLTSEARLVQTPEAEVQEELVTLESELQEANERLRQMKETAKQQTSLKDRFTSVESREAAEELQESANTQVRLMSVRRDTLEEMTATQISNNQIADQLKTMKMAKNEHAAVTLQLEKEVNDRSRDTKLPRQRETTKKQVVFYLKGGRLYTALVPNAYGVTINTVDCIETNEGGTRYVDPRPGAGIAVAAAAADEKAITAKMSVCNPSQHFARIYVWPDSYAEFQSLKNVIVARGLEYETRLMPDESQRISLGKSTRKSKVQ
jgi:hypothetical protein